MTDDRDDDWPDGLGEEQAMEIGAKVAGMADRVRAMESACPGVEAEWAFTMDGQRYVVVVRLEPRRVG